MKIRNYIFIFFVAFSTTFFLASCLNEENKIPPNCYDGLLNNGEEKIDCGGPCEECDHCENGLWDPERGETWRDCGGRCPECVPCSNGVLDVGEQAIDCGGFTCPPCTELCNDGLLNGAEEEIDCGPECPNACPTCEDGVFNGDEFGIDCGGTECDPCTTTGNCGNGATDGDEYWVDCGGSHCAACDLSFTWRIGNITHVVPVPGGTINSGAFETTGISLNDGTLYIRVIDSNPPFTSGQSFTANPANAATVLVTYTNGLTGDFYSSEFTGSSLNVSMQRYYEDVSDANPPLPTKTYVRVTFSGNLKTDDTTPLNLNIQNGVFINLFQ